MIVIFILLINVLFFNYVLPFNLPLSNNYSISQCPPMLKNYFQVDGIFYLLFSGKQFKVDLTIKNFDSFKQINFQCINSAEFIYNMKIIPKRPLILDSSFDLNFAEPISDYRQDEFIIQLSFINGFDIESQIFENTLNFYSLVEATFYYTKLKASMENWLESSNKSYYFFKFTSILKFTFTTKYYTNTCPLIFQNSNINSLFLYGMSNTFLKKNILKFSKANSTINSQISNVIFNLYNLKLDNTLLDEEIYEKVESFSFEGSLSSIETNIFKNFRNVKFLKFNIEIIKNYFKDIVNSIFVPDNKFIILDFYLEDNNLFLDSDFCYFKDFDNPRILLYLESNKPLFNCTCSLIWIYRFFISNMKFFNSYYEVNSWIRKPIPFFRFPCLNLDQKMADSCDFKTKLNNCNHKLMKYVNEKNFDVNGIYCSKIVRNISSQIFNIVIIEFFLNFLKFWSNTTLILISWTRLSLLTKEKSNSFEWSNRKFKIVLIVLIVVSVILWLDKFFTVRVNQNFFIFDEKDYDQFPNKNTFQDYFIVLKRSINSIKYYGLKSLIFYFLFILNFLLNDLVILVVMLLLDFIMLYELRKKIKMKQNFAQTLNRKLNLEKMENDENRITWVVVLNTFILILIKTFHLSISFYILINKFGLVSKLRNLCLTKFCSEFQEIIDLLYSLSNVYTCVLFYNLNKGFKDESLKLLKRILCTKSQR
ncbi:unnamed protein product [Brachionus calyciflorus]|uniref:Uncharacterized protein n=1 Tax=Brachionus calyciflorus TaxID=104777 RepID=A0A813Z245_9BILA|nr:unnamed protein product [Brachionus calyciflorus]